MSSEGSSELPPAAKKASEEAVRSALKELHASQATADAKEGGTEEGEITEDPNKKISVFDDQHHFNVVHPLFNTWTLWFDNASKQDKAKDWNEQLQQVMEIKSVEEFWGLYNNIVPPSHIAVNSNYYLFKKGVKPAWEDDANAKGGKWAVQLPRDKSRENIDRWWLYTMLAAIGETLETPYTSDGSVSSEAEFTDEVTGVIVSSRKMFYRINIWTRSSDDAAKKKLENIGKQFKYHVLSVPQEKKFEAGKSGIATDVEFTSHSSAQKGSRNSRGSSSWTV